MVGDSFENVASLQDCHFQQRDSVQTLGKSLPGLTPPQSGPNVPGKTIPALGKQQSVFVRVTGEYPHPPTPTSASVEQNNGPFLLGVNTKQLSNQMLELTKVINELKDVLIQQVTSPLTVPLRPLNPRFPAPDLPRQLCATAYKHVCV